MALFRRFFYRKPPDRLLEISERVYVFDCCFSTNILDGDEYKVYMGGIVTQLQDHYPDASFMVFNFREGERRSQISDILSHYDMTVMEYPRHYEGCPLLPLEMIHHFLRSSESWLSLEGQRNVLLMHCERGGWPVLAFMLAGLLLYRKQYSGEQKTLEMIYKQAPRELLHHLSHLNPQPSQSRYLQYISRWNLGSDWPPSDTPLALDHIILRVLPSFDGGKGCRPVIRVYGQDRSSNTATRSSKLLFSTSKKKKSPRLCRQEECELVKIDIRCRVQGDVILECIHLDDDLVGEEMMFRVVFHTAFVRSNVLMLNRDEIDVLWGVKDQFPKEFKAEVLFSDADAVPSVTTAEVAGEDENETESASPDEFFEVEEIFSSAVDGQDGKRDLDSHVVHVENYIVVRKEVLQTHPFQDSVLDDGNSKHDGREDAESGVVEAFVFDDRDDSESTVMISDVPSRVENVVVAADVSCELEEMEGRKNADNSAMWNSLEKQGPWQNVSVEPKVADAVVSGKLEETEKRLDREDTTLQNNFERQALQQKLSANINRKKSDKSLPLAQKKQPSSNAKPAADLTATKQKFKQQEPQGTFARQAKPNAVSRWIPSNKGSYTNSMHVYYPPSARYNTPPPAPAHAKDPYPGGKSKATAASGAVVETDKIPKSVSHAVDYVRSANDEPVKHTSCSPSLDITPLQATNPPSSTSPTLHQGTLKVPPPPPPPPSLKKTSNVLSSQDPAILPQFVARLASPSPTLPPLLRPPPNPSTVILLSNSSTSSLQSASTMQQMQAKSPPPTLPPPPPPPPPPTPAKNALLLTSLPLTLVPPPPPNPPVLNISHTSKQVGVGVSTPPPQPPLPLPPHFPAHGVPTPLLIPPPCPLSALPPPPRLPRHGASPPPPPPPPPSRGAPPPPPLSHETPPLLPMVGQPPLPASLGGAPPPPPPPGGHPLGPPPPLGPPRPPGGAPPLPPPSGSKGLGAGVPPPPPGKWHVLSSPTTLALATRRSNLKPLHWSKVTRALQGSLWEEFQRHGEPPIAPEFDVSELERLFSATVPKSDSGGKSGGRRKSVESKTDKVHLIDLRRANNTEIMLTKVKMPLPDMMAAALAMDESILDADQVENLIKFCPTKEEMELLKGYTGDKENLGKCEQFFLELMKVPRVESKLRVFFFKIQFNSQISDFKRSLNTVNAACVEVRNSLKLKEIMKKILYLGNTLNQGTARGSAVGFKLDSLLKLTDTRASNKKMTLMHYLCKVLSFKSPTLLDFHEDLISLDAASKIQLKSLAEEMQAIIKGLEKVKQELVASENDGPVSEAFHKTSKEFIGIAEAEVASVTNLYSVVGKNADALALYFGEDPSRCPFEQVIATLLNFVRLFRIAHEENCKQAELEKKKAEKEAEVEKAKGINLTKKSEN